MKAILDELVDLVDLLNLEPRDSELSIEFFDRAVIEALEQGLITDDEADLFAGWMNEVAA